MVLSNVDVSLAYSSGDLFSQHQKLNCPIHIREGKMPYPGKFKLHFRQPLERLILYKGARL